MRLVATPRCQESQAEESRYTLLPHPGAKSARWKNRGYTLLPHPVAKSAKWKNRGDTLLPYPVAKTYLPLLHLRLELDQLPSLYLVAIPCCQNLPTLAAKMLPEPLLPTFLATRNIPDPVARPCCQSFFMSNPVA
jgi:hypothetical protein